MTIIAGARPTPDVTAPSETAAASAPPAAALTGLSGAGATTGELTASAGAEAAAGANAVVLAASSATTMTAQAEAVGLTVLAAACWPAGPADNEPPMLPAFIVSTFSPMIAEVATRCLTAARPDHADGADASTPTAIVVMSPLGDVASAEHVARAVDDGDRIGPLLFFQAVPNAVAGLIAARWGLAGPMVSLGAGDGGLDLAALFIDDGDAADALVILAESAPDRAVALLVAAAEPPCPEGEQ